MFIRFGLLGKEFLVGKSAQIFPYIEIALGGEVVKQG
jgi:hypothetical protein